MNDPTQDKKSWDRPEGASFDDWMNSRVARFQTRRYDWDALKFQADYDPKYRRAQMRYLGTGGTADAFVAAFRFPNMFRRIFGEGAFNSAYVPLFARELEEHGRDAAELFARRAFTILALILGAGTIVAIPAMPVIMCTQRTSRFSQSATYASISAPDRLHVPWKIACRRT